MTNNFKAKSLDTSASYSSYIKQPDPKLWYVSMYTTTVFTIKYSISQKLSYTIIYWEGFDNFKHLQRKLNQFSIKYKIFSSIEVYVKVIIFLKRMYQS